MTFYIKQGDTAPPIKYQLQDSDGNPKDLTNFTEVEFHFKKKGVGNTIANDNTSGNVTVTDASNGEVEYQWKQGDTSETGMHLAEWQVTYADGSKETFPNRGSIEVRIQEQIV